MTSFSKLKVNDESKKASKYQSAGKKGMSSPWGMHARPVTAKYLKKNPWFKSHSRARTRLRSVVAGPDAADVGIHSISFAERVNIMSYYAFHHSSDAVSHYPTQWAANKWFPKWWCSLLSTLHLIDRPVSDYWLFSWFGSWYNEDMYFLYLFIFSVLPSNNPYSQ